MNMLVGVGKGTDSELLIHGGQGRIIDDLGTLLSALPRACSGTEAPLVLGLHLDLASSIYSQ